MTSAEPGRCRGRHAGMRLVATLAALFVLHCTVRSDGLVVEVRFSHAPTAVDPQTGALSVPLADGAVWGLSQAYVTVYELSLLPCEQATAAARPRPGQHSPRRKAWSGQKVDPHRMVAALGPSRARAHGQDAPRTLAIPHVLDLLSPGDASVATASLAPPPGDYCAVRLRIDAADADAEGLPGEVDMVTRSLWLAGPLRGEPDAGGTPWSLQSAAGRAYELPLRSADGPFVRLDTDASPAILRVRFDVAAALATIASDAYDDAALAVMLVHALLQTASVQICEPSDAGDACDR